MKPFFDMIVGQIYSVFTQYIIHLVLFAIIITFVIFFIEKLGIRNILFDIKEKFIKESNYKWKILFYTYLYFIIDKSLLSRSRGMINSLEFAFKRDWLFLVKDTWSRVQAVENILFFIPFSYFFILAFTEEKNRDFKLLKNITKLSFLLSLSIEIIQLILTIGTFQLSDIVYNILGGIIDYILIILS